METWIAVEIGLRCALELTSLAYLGVLFAKAF